ncbi:MAG: S41 family peptidase [Anaerolineae bacterium]|nr:MAG: S41 family peptidase [Anaerolineae bacterium]
MRSNAWKVGLVLAVGMGLTGLAFTTGVALGYVAPRITAASGEARPIELAIPQIISRDEITPEVDADQEQLIAPFWEAWEILHDDYVDQPLDDEALMRGAIRGLVDALEDPHTSYMDPEQFLQANLPLNGEYEGIGAWVDSEAEYLTIISTMPGSPAEEAGLQAGDEVIGVNGEDVTGLDASLVIRQVLGPAGTPVNLTLRREGLAEPFDVEIVRAKIDLPSVQSEMLDDNIAYVRLLTFGADTAPDLARALRDLLRDDPVGLILDLRGNGGGFLNSAVDVASEFIPDGVILIERFGDGEETIYQARSGGKATEIGLVVLINGGSASASEIVAGAIQDHGRGLLVGETSFGKGSVQNWVELDNNQGAVRVTIARWYTPGDRLIHGIGLTPDVEVLIPESGLDEGVDPQLDEAIKLLLGEAGPSR